MSERDTKPAPFAILATPRTGSWFLVELLNQHRNVACNGEVANLDDTSGWPTGRERLSDQQLLELAFLQFPVRGRKSHLRWVGCKFLSEHAALPGRSGILSALAGWPDLAVIVLRRENPLESLRSMKQAQLTGQWQALAKNGEPAAQPTVRIDPQEFLAHLEQTEEFYRWLDESFAQKRSVQVAYEDLRDHTQAVMDEICNFLEIPRAQLESSALLRQEARSLERAVENFADLESLFSGTPYSKYFL